MKSRKLTPEQEMARIQRDFKDHWSKLENLPAIQKAIADNNPIALGEEAAKAVYGNYGENWPLTKQELEAGAEDWENHKMYKMREDLIRRKKDSN